MPLTPKQRRALRGLAHHLEPVVIVGGAGMSEAVVSKTVDELEYHELIKIKAPAGQAKTLGPELATATDAELVQVIGRVVVLYRRRKEKPAIVLPKA